MTPNSFPAAAQHRLPVAPKFTPAQFGTAFLTLNRGQLGHALGMVLDVIRSRHEPADCNYDDLHDDLLAAAELSKALAVAADPVINARLGLAAGDQPADPTTTQEAHT